LLVNVPLATQVLLSAFFSHFCCSCLLLNLDAWRWLWFHFFILQNVMHTRNSELHSLEELRSQFGQFRESVLKELLPVSSPPPQQSSGLNASSLHDASAVVPQPHLSPTLEEPAPACSAPDHLRATHIASVSSGPDSDEEVDDAHSSFATHSSSSRARTPQRQSPSSQAVARTLSPAEAGKQAHVVERERDSLLSSGLYHDNGENVANLWQICQCTSMCHSLSQIH
jgi:hypothetical protein